MSYAGALLFSCVCHVSARPIAALPATHPAYQMMILLLQLSVTRDPPGHYDYTLTITRIRS